MRIPTLLAAACLVLVSCQQEEGCTDPTATNFNPEATEDDGSCIAWQCGDQVEYDDYNYSTVPIGDQCWFAENLRTELYQNGDSIPSNLSNDAWYMAGYNNQGASAIYGSPNCTESVPEFDACDNSLTLEFFGRLYNRFAVDDSRKLCPSDWSVSSESDWYDLQSYITSTVVSYTFADYLKSTSGWINGQNGWDILGFDARPNGWRYANGYCQNAGLAGIWWTSTNSNTAVHLHDEAEALESSNDQRFNGYGVRCIKD